MDPKEPIQNAPDPVLNSKFFKWLDNVWYHYKWHIIISLFFAVTITVCAVQCATRETYDARLVYAGGKVFTAKEQKQINECIAECAPTDYDNNGKKTVQFIPFPIFSNGTVVQGNTEAERDFGNFLNTGECSVWLVSQYVYESFQLSTRAVPLSEILQGDLSGAAVDEYALAFEKTVLYQSLPEELKSLFPQDEKLYLVLGKSTIFGRTADEQQYSRDCALFVAIAGYPAL